MPRLRISIATVMMLVVTAAAASGLAARLLGIEAVGELAQAAGAVPGDALAVLILAIALTALALAARKRHTANQAMLQATLSCLGFLFVFSLAEIPSKRLQLYWLQALFAALVVAPLLARRAARARLDRGPRRAWWMGTFEAIAFAYLNMFLVSVGAGVEGLAIAALR